jgi:ribonuclease P protein component
LTGAVVRLGRVRTRAGFAALATSDRRARRGVLRLTAVLDEGAGRAAVAFAVGRAVGPAVVRNRVRRRLRAAFVDLGPCPGTYLVAVAPSAATSSFALLRADLAAALTEVGALEPAPTAARP